MPPQMNHALPSNNAVLNNINKNAGPRAQNGGQPNGRMMQNGGVQNGGVRHYNNLNGHIPQDNEATLHDLEAVSELETISKRVQGTIQNGVNNLRGIPNGIMNGHGPKGTAVGNGFVQGDKFRDLDQQRREHIRNMYQGMPLDSHI